jgi:hypothetical protein
MNEYIELRKYSFGLYLQFLKQHIRSQNLIPTKDEEVAVKAFCVLAHAALEEYFEEISLSIIKGAYRRFEAKNFIDTLLSNQQQVDEVNKIMTSVIQTFVLASCFYVHTSNGSKTFKAYKSKINEINKPGETLTTDVMSKLKTKAGLYAKEILHDTVAFFEDHLRNNHGASLKYLLKILIPCGIDIPDELSLLNSLQKLADYRGKYAHTTGNLNVVLSASDAVVYMRDTIKLCGLIDMDASLLKKYLSA